MRMAMATVDTKIDYINPHATSTPAGDPPENRGDPQGVRDRRTSAPPIGRHQGADRTFARRHRRAGGDLFAPDDAKRASSCESANITELDPVFADMPIRSQTRRTTQNSEPCFRNSFGFRGTNATLVFQAGWMREIARET